MTVELHNMSVPPTSTVAVRRATLAGRRFRVDLRSGVSERRLRAVERRLAATGWRAAWAILRAAGDRAAMAAKRGRGPQPRASAAALERRLAEALAEAGVPDRLGVFVDEEPCAAEIALDAAASLAVLSRRSGPLYLPTRRFEPSLARLSAVVLFFPDAVSPRPPARLPEEP